jgi:hypothetical protein
LKVNALLCPAVRVPWCATCKQQLDAAATRSERSTSRFDRFGLILARKLATACMLRSLDSHLAWWGMDFLWSMLVQRVAGFVPQVCLPGAVCLRCCFTASLYSYYTQQQQRCISSNGSKECESSSLSCDTPDRDLPSCRLACRCRLMPSPDGTAAFPCLACHSVSSTAATWRLGKLTYQ